MSKRTIYFLGILATLIIGFFLHWYFCCNDNCTKDTMTGETSQARMAYEGKWEKLLKWQEELDGGR